MREQRLLSKTGSNAKTIKSDKGGEYLTAIMYLAPAKVSGKEVCPARSPGCSAGCLYTAGRAEVFPSIMKSRVRKTKLFHNDRTAFLARLHKDIGSHVRKCEKLGVKPTVRLNGTSDIPWEIVAPSVFTAFPDVQFYDYTKIETRMGTTWKKPLNYHLTFSRSEKNEDACRRVLAQGGNVAAVFRNGMPDSYMGKPVYSGDKHDLRFTDPEGRVIGLVAKGRARKDKTGFVVNAQTEISA